MTPTRPHGLTPAAYARWLSLTTEDQERVIDMVEDDREDEAMAVLGMNSAAQKQSNQSPDALRARGITPEES